MSKDDKLSRTTFPNIVFVHYKLS